MGQRVFLSAFVSALTSVVMFLLMHYVFESRLPVVAAEVPPLAGLSPEQARGILEPRGLLLVLEGERVDDHVAPGTISEQKPLGGSRLQRGAAVHASLARAGAPPSVPNIVGQPIELARAALVQARLRLGATKEAPSDVVARGLVLSTSPPVGSETKADTLVDVVLSSGPATQAVPSVIGKRLSTAKDILSKAGFGVGSSKYGSSDDYDEGVVIRQSPAAGSQASPGVKIDLTINE
jgi:serine/threonine-protein kinase